MGLDMFLSRKVYIPENKRQSVKIEGVEHVRTEKVKYIEEDVGYWRKANAIHNWFVHNVQNGEDNCGEYYVEWERLVELKELVDQVCADHSLAESLLPTTSGFFFGSTDYDEYYFQDLEYTRDLLQEIIDYGMAVRDDTFSGGDYYYHSSW